jgi:hypothetical protein
MTLRIMLPFFGESVRRHFSSPSGRRASLFIIDDPIKGREDRDLGMKTAAKGTVGDVVEQVVNQRHGLGPSEWGKPVSSLYATARMR